MIPAMTDHHRWFRSYPPDVPHTVEPLPDISVFGMLEASARKYPAATAIAWFGKDITYRELLAEVETCSAALASSGVGRGDRVALVMPNCPQYLIAFYATVRLGAVVVGNNPLYTKREMEHQLRDCGAKVVIVLDLLYSDFAEVFHSLELETIVAGLEEYMPFPKKQLAPALKFKKTQREQGKPWPPVPSGAPVKRWTAWMRAAGTVPVAATVDPANDAAGFIYTGGTTGVSKGAMLSHRNLVANATQGAAYLQLAEGQEGLLGSLPFFHSFGMLVMNVGVLIAAKLTPIPNPRDLHLVMEEIQKEKPTFVPGVPRFFNALNESPDVAKFDLRSVKACISGGAPLPRAVADRFAEITGGAILVEGYGLTESSPVTHANPLQGVRKSGSIGVPIPDTECKIIDLEDPERILDVGERGELCIRGPQIMLGYWNRPEETALAVRNGWLHTGDVAVMDEDGYFFIVDRLKEMILVSGFNVYPNEVEDALYHHPKISKVAVIGVPDDKTGEAVKAFVVLKDGVTATPEEIVAWARDPANGLTAYRAPKQVEFRDELPETMIGKVLRRVLLEQERAKAAATAST
jgi:long-chain acyl-CoA synthetase